MDYVGPFHTKTRKYDILFGKLKLLAGPNKAFGSVELKIA